MTHPNNEFELTQLDTRFENLKTRDCDQEKKMLASLVEGDICEPLLVTQQDVTFIVLDGFKRLRAARKLKWSVVSCSVIGQTEAEGVIEFLRRSRGNKTSMYEEACYVRRLHREHGMSNADISNMLKRSKGWVSMRLSFFEGMSEATRQKIQAGRFPLHSWMYTVRPFTRMNSKHSALGDEFVGLIDSKDFSLREVDLLANAWFTGNDDMKNEIRQGNSNRVVQRLQKTADDGIVMSPKEYSTLKTLTRLADDISSWVLRSFENIDTTSKEFKVQAHLESTRVLGLIGQFTTTMEDFRDRCSGA